MLQLKLPWAIQQQCSLGVKQISRQKVTPKAPQKWLLDRFLAYSLFPAQQ